MYVDQAIILGRHLVVLYVRGITKYCYAFAFQEAGVEEKLALRCYFNLQCTLYNGQSEIRTNVG